MAADLALRDPVKVSTDVDEAVPRDAWDAAVAVWLSSFDSANTVKAYRTDAAQWRAWCDEAGIYPPDAARRHLDGWARTMDGKIAKSTIRRKLSAVASAYHYCVLEGWIESSPAAHVRRPKGDDDYSPTISLDDKQLHALLLAAEEDGPLALAAVTTLVLTGARAEEFLSADVQSIREDHGHQVLEVLRKGAKRQRLVLPARAVRALRAYLGDRATGPLALGSQGRLTYAQLYALVRRLGRKAGLTVAVTPHVLRATFATLSLDAGVPLADLQDAMGHADPRVTRLYDRGKGKLDRVARPGEAVAKALLDVAA